MEERDKETIVSEQEDESTIQQDSNVEEKEQNLEDQSDENIEPNMTQDGAVEDQITDINNENEVEEDREQTSIDDIEALRSELKKVQEEQERTHDRLLRLQAEYDNYKKRTEKERIAERQYKSQDLANELLPAMDNFERALQVEVNDHNKSIIEGITMVYNQLEEALKSQGIEKINALHEPFDPNIHHAVMQVEDEGLESNVVVEVLQTGYKLKDRVIRPAMVKVNK